MNFVGTPFGMYRRSGFGPEHRFDTGLAKMTEDWDFWLRCAQQRPFRVVPRVFYLYRQHGGPRITKNPTRHSDGLLEFVAKHHDTMKPACRAYHRCVADLLLDRRGSVARRLADLARSSPADAAFVAVVLGALLGGERARAAPARSGVDRSHHGPTSQEPLGPMTAAGRKPNLFIVGAPKSGTTALWTYLRQHPDIYTAGKDHYDSDLPAAGGKEYQYFGGDLASNIDTRRSLESYMAVFAPASDERYLLDASPMYLCSELAAVEIAAFSPEARAIAVLRNPVDMMYSLHGEALFQGDEDIVDFEEALGAEDDRRQGKRIPPTCQGALWSLFYRDVARYADQLDRFFDALGPRPRPRHRLRRLYGRSSRRLPRHAGVPGSRCR